jgi:hypothetical protein
MSGAPTQAAEVDALVSELAQLVRMAAQRPELLLEVGPPACGWSFNWVEARVRIDPGDLVSRAPDLCRGLVVHEAAHAAVTRLDLVLPLPELQRWMPLLNVIEDCRIETWIRARFPGAASWVRAYNDVLFGEMRASPQPRARRSQFARALLEQWWFGAPSAGLHPAVQTALTQTAQPVSDAIACQPPTDALDPARVLRAQRGMWASVQSGVLPVWERLGALDQADGLGATGDEELQRLLAMLGAAGHLQSGTAAGATRRAPTAARSQGAGAGAARDAARAAIARTLGTDGSDDYLRAWKSVQALTDRVADELLRTLLPRRRMRWTHGHPWGTRLDLRRAMQFSADPRLHDRLWMRPVLPDRRDPEIVLLLDRSGSMRSESRMQRAFEALVLLVEAARRVGVPTAVWSFANDARRDLATDTELDAEGRKAVGRLLSDCDGSTDLTAALRAVRAAFAESSAGQKLLFVLSDGEPNDRDSAAAGIAALERDGVRCIGLGLGQGTAPLRELFAIAAVEVPVTAIAARIGELLLRALDVTAR